MNSRTTSSSDIQYKIDDELILSPEHHRLPISAQLIELAGLTDKKTQPEELPLAQVILRGAVYDDKWMVQATVGEENVGSIWCDPGTKRENVLDVASEWIRTSTHVASVAGSVQEIQTPEEEQSFSIYGVILVRGDRP